jgi:hypothetical protein
LLETLIDYWELEGDDFMIREKSTKIETENIYFLIGMPHRRNILNLKGATIDLMINEYIDLYFSTKIEKVGSQLPIR